MLRYAKILCKICLFALLSLGSASAWALSPPLERVGYLQLGNGGDVNSVAVNHPYVYAGHPNGELYVVDVGDPSNPAVAHQLSLRADTLAFHNNLLVVGSDDELTVLDVSNAEQPNQIGSLALGAAVHDIAISGSYAYVGTESDGPNGTLNEFRVIDLGNPADPIEIGGIDTGAIDRNSYSIYSIALDQNHAYVARGAGFDNRNAFSVIDISDPTSPALIAELGISAAISGLSVSVIEDHAYVGVYDGSERADFAIVDISTPSSPSTTKTFVQGQRVTATYPVGQFVLAGSGASGLTAFEVSTPENALALESFDIEAKVSGIVASNDYAYVASWSNSRGNFQVIDISAIATEDTTPPTVQMRPPHPSALSGTVLLSATATDDIRVADVRFQADTVGLGTATTDDLVSPFTVMWDTNTVADGIHALTAVATDPSGNTTSSNEVFVEVNNAAGDQMPPQVQMVLPDESTRLANAVLVSAKATDNFEVGSVQFLLDDVALGEPVTEPPFTIAWNTATANNGVHRLSARATDSSGNQAVARSLSVTVDNRYAWDSDFSPLREFYVSSNGTGNGVDEQNPMSLSAALEQAMPGDLYWLTGGTYSADSGVELSKAGTADHPIVFRAVPDEHVHFRGYVEMTADYNWLWGVEVSDPDLTPGNPGISLEADHVRAINNVVHDVAGSPLAMPDGYTGVVAYGNIIYGGTETPGVQRSHLVYPQNTFDDHGYKYFAGNVFLDAPPQSCNLSQGAQQDCFLFHAYSTAARIQGFHLEDNIFADGRFLIGGYGLPTDREVVRGNAFYDVVPRFGYRRPTQVEFTQNYLGRGAIQQQWWWGTGEERYTPKAPNIFSSNEIYSESGNSLFMARTSAYTSEGRQEGVPAIPTSDQVDENIYSEPFRAEIQANDTHATADDLPTWQTVTANAGRTFDANSQVVPFPSTTKVIVFSNDYEVGRAHLAVYNWGLEQQVSVDLSEVLTDGAEYTIRDVKDAFGSPRASGVYDGSNVTVPTGGAEFLPLLLTSVGSTEVCTPRGPDDNCNGIDEDCDGTADDDFIPITLQCGDGACARTGTGTCEDGQVVSSCQPGESLDSQDRTCDGVDDDCDGTIDEEYAPEKSTCGSGDCVATGITSCIDGVLHDSCTVSDCQPSDGGHERDGGYGDAGGEGSDAPVDPEATAGGCSCTATGSERPVWPLLVLGGVVLLKGRSRRWI